MLKRCVQARHAALHAAGDCCGHVRVPGERLAELPLDNALAERSHVKLGRGEHGEQVTHRLDIERMRDSEQAMRLEQVA